MIKSLSSAFVSLAMTASLANAYWLMGAQNTITTERIDPIVNPGAIAGHVHSVVGGSNFRFSSSSQFLRESQCTSVPIAEDKSNYWYPHLYFHANDGTFKSLTGGVVIYYLFNDKPGTTTAFPEDFRMLSGNPNLRSYNAASFAQQAVSFLCLDFDNKQGGTSRHAELPVNKKCPSGVRSQINFPSCWDGKNLDSPSHTTHVAFPSGGPDSGTCNDPKYPVTLPRIFLEVYWDTNSGVDYAQAKNPQQPFVFAQGDGTGYGFHADFFNGWDKGVLQKAVDGCNCNPYGDFTCCVDKGIFTKKKEGTHCRITPAIDERTTGVLNALPGGNKVTGLNGKPSPAVDPAPPNLISPVFAYEGDKPTQSGTVTPNTGNTGGAVPPVPSQPPVPSSQPPVVSSSQPPVASSSAIGQPIPSSMSTSVRPPTPSSSSTRVPGPSSSSPASTGRPQPSSTPLPPQQGECKSHIRKRAILKREAEAMMLHKKRGHRSRANF